MCDFSVEEIPDEDRLGRLIYFPSMYQKSEGLIWHVIFQFPGNEGECLLWAKYALETDGMHAIGISQGQSRKERNPVSNYEGYIPAVAGSIRSIKTARGHGFTVVHDPSEGQPHVEVRMHPAPDLEIKKNDKNELKAALRNVFGELIPFQRAIA